MKKTMLITVLLVFTGLIFTEGSEAQEQDNNSNFSVSSTFASNYVWRGSNYGNGPHIQPQVSFSTGGLTLGVWGSFDFSGYKEADPFLSYSFPFGLSLGFTDYYYPGSSFFETSAEDGNHAFELNGSYSTGGLSLSANYIINEAGGAASMGGDLYFQAGYEFGSFNIFAGAGNGWHTTDGEFDLCNIGIGTDATIEITEKFSLPVSGQVILNPDREQLYLVVSVSF